MLSAITKRKSRLSNNPAIDHGFNLLKYRAVRSVVGSSAFPSMLQMLLLLVFTTLAIMGWGLYTPNDVNAKLYAKTNLVSLAMWGLWWPGIVWVTFLVGRVWCIVCPLELVSFQAERMGQKLGISQRPLPRLLASGGLVVLLFAFLQLLVPGVQIHRVPHYTSLFLWTSLTIAFAVGLFFMDRSFCRGFCPVSILLSAYGRGGMLAVRPAGQNGCQSNNTASKVQLCRSLLNPARLHSNKHCLVCGDCIKADTTDAMQLLIRAPFSKADAREQLASWPVTLFVIIVSGFVTYELSGVWKSAETVFLWVPRQISMAFNLSSANGWIQGLWTILILPLLLWTLLGSLTMVLGGAKSLGDAWRRLALPMVVVVATGHMAKGLEKFTSWVGFIPYAWTDPTGVRTAIKMNSKIMPQPLAWLTLPTLSIAAMSLLLVGMSLALRETRLADSERSRARFVPIVLFSGFYVFLVFGWGGWVK